MAVFDTARGRSAGRCDDSQQLKLSQVIKGYQLDGQIKKRKSGFLSKVFFTSHRLIF